MTFGELKNRVAEYLGEVSDYMLSLIPDWINSAIREIEDDFDFPYMYAVASDLAITPGQNEIDISSLTRPIKKPLDKFILIDSSSVYKVEYEDNDDIRYDAINTPAGVPRRFTRIADVLYFDKPFDKAYQHEFPYMAYTKPFVDDTDSNWLTDNYWQVVLYKTLLYSEPFLVNDARISTWEALYNNYISKLSRIYVKRVKSRLEGGL